MQKWYELWFQMTSLLSEHALCILYQSRKFANTKNNQLPA